MAGGLRGVMVVLWRAAFRISEALVLTETDLDPERGALLLRHGKGGKRREVGMDRWDGRNSSRGLSYAATWPSGRCSASCGARLEGDPVGRPVSAARCTASRCRRPCVGLLPTSCGMPMRLRCLGRAYRWLVIQRQLGHADLGITSTYLRGIDNTEIIHAVHQRPAPMIPAGLHLTTTEPPTDRAPEAITQQR